MNILFYNSEKKKIEFFDTKETCGVTMCDKVSKDDLCTILNFEGRKDAFMDLDFFIDNEIKRIKSEFDSEFKKFSDEVIHYAIFGELDFLQDLSNELDFDFISDNPELRDKQHDLLNSYLNNEH